MPKMFLDTLCSCRFYKPSAAGFQRIYIQREILKSLTYKKKKNKKYHPRHFRKLFYRLP